MTSRAGREVLFEFVVLGAFVRVNAIDPETGLEASALGPVGAARSDLQRLALRKLERMIAGPMEPQGPNEPQGLKSPRDPYPKRGKKV